MMKPLARLVLLLVPLCAGILRADIVEGGEIEVTVKKVESAGKIAVVAGEKPLTLALSGIKAGATEERLTAEIRKLAALSPKVFVKVDRIEGDQMSGQMYVYAFKIGDEVEQKAALDLIRKRPASTRMRWGGINLNLRVIELGLARYDEGSAVKCEDLFKTLAKSAAEEAERAGLKER